MPTPQRPQNPLIRGLVEMAVRDNAPKSPAQQPLKIPSNAELQKLVRTQTQRRH